MSLWIHLKILGSPHLRDRRSFQQSLDLINERLISVGLPTYRYPFELNLASLSLPEIDTSRSELTQLKYVAAMLSEDENWIPTSDFKRFSSNQIPIYLKEKIVIENKSHLLCNYHGKYIPLDFGGTVLPPRFLESIGSSINLKNEMELLANQLNLKLVDSMCDADHLINTMVDELEDDPLLMSKIIMIRFYSVVVASIRYNLIICMD